MKRRHQAVERQRELNAGRAQCAVECGGRAFGTAKVRPQCRAIDQAEQQMLVVGKTRCLVDRDQPSEKWIKLSRTGASIVQP